VKNFEVLKIVNINFIRLCQLYCLDFFASFIFISYILYYLIFLVNLIKRIMADQISTKVLTAIGAGGTLTAALFLTPQKYVWGVSSLILAAAGLGVLLKSQWV